MKKNIILIIAIIAILLTSFTTIKSNLTDRSKQQVIITSNNTDYISSTIKRYYQDGYRVTDMVAQSVSLHRHNDDNIIHTATGNIIVIMEK